MSEDKLPADERLNAVVAMNQSPGWEIFLDDMRKSMEALVEKSRRGETEAERENARLAANIIEDQIVGGVGRPGWIARKIRKLNESVKKGGSGI